MFDTDRTQVTVALSGPIFLKQGDHIDLPDEYSDSLKPELIQSHIYKWMYADRCLCEGFLFAVVNEWYKRCIFIY